MKTNNYSVLLKGKNVDCKGIFCKETNNLTILKGSIIRKKVSPNFKYNAKRLEQIREYCKEQDETYILIKDAVFNTPTAAAKFSLGYEVNGTIYWRTSDNIRLKDLLK